MIEAILDEYYRQVAIEKRIPEEFRVTGAGFAELLRNGYVEVRSVVLSDPYWYYLDTGVEAITRLIICDDEVDHG